MKPCTPLLSGDNQQCDWVSPMQGNIYVTTCSEQCWLDSSPGGFLQPQSTQSCNQNPRTDKKQAFQSLNVSEAVPSKRLLVWWELKSAGQRDVSAQCSKCWTLETHACQGPGLRWGHRYLNFILKYKCLTLHSHQTLVFGSGCFPTTPQRENWAFFLGITV